MLQEDLSGLTYRLGLKFAWNSDSCVLNVWGVHTHFGVKFMLARFDLYTWTNLLY